MKVSGFSGNQVYTTELIQALVKTNPGNQYQLITNWHTRQTTQKVFGNSSSVAYRNILPGQLMLGKAFKTAIAELNQSIQGWISGSFDLYHCTNPMRFPKKVGNVVVTLHDLIALSKEAWAKEGTKKFYQSHIEQILNKAKVIFTVSNFTKSEALNYFPALENKIVVTPLGFNQQFVKRSPNREFLKKYGISDIRKPYLLYVGELQPRKNIFSMLRVYNSLPNSIQKAISFIIIGRAKSKAIQEEFDRFKNSLRVESQIYQFSGVPIEDLVQFYNAAEAFVFVSLSEGFGLPVLEAMACGCPVLTSNTTSLAEVAGNAAITVDPKDQNAIEEGLLKLLDDSVLRDKLKQRGLEHAKTFSWEKTAQLTMQGYKMAVS